MINTSPLQQQHKTFGGYYEFLFHRWIPRAHRTFKASQVNVILIIQIGMAWVWKLLRGGGEILIYVMIFLLRLQLSPSYRLSGSHILQTDKISESVLTFCHISFFHLLVIYFMMTAVISLHLVDLMTLIMLLLLLALYVLLKEAWYHIQTWRLTIRRGRPGFGFMLWSLQLHALFCTVQIQMLFSLDCHCCLSVSDEEEEVDDWSCSHWWYPSWGVPILEYFPWHFWYYLIYSKLFCSNLL